MKTFHLSEETIPKLFILVYLTFCFSIFYNSHLDIRLIATSNYDAVTHMQSLRGMFLFHRWHPNHFWYGDAYFYLAAMLSFIYKIFQPIDKRVFIVSLFSINMIFGVLTIDILWRLVRKYFSCFVAVCSLSFLITNHSFMYWSIYSHPDVMQQYFVLMTIYYVCMMVEEASKKNIILSSLFAGLAFGTKYIGIFLLPTILFGYLIYHLKRPDFKWRFLLGAEFWKSFFLSAAVFVVSFAITSPSHLYHFRTFLNVIVFVRKLKMTGHWFIADKNLLLWLPIIYKEDILGRAFSILFVGYLALVFVRFIRDPGRFRKNISPIYVPLFWVCSFLFYMFKEVHARFQHYCFPVFPFMVIYSAVCVEEIGMFMKRNGFLMRWRKVFVAGVLLAGLVPRIVLGYEFFMKESFKIKDTNIEGGLWLEKNFPASTKILYDNFAYIPHKFKHVYVDNTNWGMSYESMESFKPDVIVTHKYLSNQFDKESKAKLYWGWGGAEEYLKHFYFYRDLREGKIPSFQLIKDFGDMKIYATPAKQKQLNKLDQEGL